MNRDRSLPPFARELAEVIGWDSMLALCEAYGGLPLWVPRSLAADSALPIHLGIRCAEQLVRAYGGTRIEPPKLTAMQTSRRDDQIRQEIAAGARTWDLAQRHNLTVRHIRRIIATG